MRLVLYCPEIAQNAGAATRSAACFDARLDIVEPCGFPLGEKGFRRSAMDYGLRHPPQIHSSWREYTQSAARRAGRLILLTTKSPTPLWALALQESDSFLIGQESAGVPDFVHDHCDAAVRIPISAEARSLNMATAAAIVLAEARRQSGWSNAPS